jgi:mono/diheme cytochrome c family protein
MRSAALVITALLGAFVLAACVEAAPRVSDDMVHVARRDDPTASSDSLAQGRELFVQRCDTCHELPAVSSQTLSAWPHIVDTMTKRSALDDQQHQAVLRYILAAHDLAK